MFSGKGFTKLCMKKIGGVSKLEILLVSNFKLVFTEKKSNVDL